MTKGSGCLPLDEAIILGDREFKAKFEKDAVSLDDFRLELGNGVDKAKVRVVKEIANHSFGGGCP